ncbi:unnamed protein product, partial [Mesorhabditis spiculigera]
MVEIREESTEPAGSSPTSSGPSTSRQPPPPQPRNTLMDFLKDRTLDSINFALRIVTIFFALSYLLPLASAPVQRKAYFKAFAAAMATNALRLQQRIGPVRLNMEFMQRLFTEDSCHYLLYSILFVLSEPITMALLPIMIFAALQATNFFVTLMTAIGQNNSPVVPPLTRLIQNQTPNCLGIVACAEIFLAPALFASVLMGQTSLVTPIGYYRFLVMRYGSQRNPYTRQAFYQMRVSLDQVAANPSCPGLVRTFIYKSISFISSLHR